ncbi:hypothetical protein NDU88_004150 [Pleurodeles waltl]|uniref:Ig-like domain-containing protein n=1 Tax=Pleurodeles waltl TaxID=8319 RepID=A0AAV7RKH8_PLEWA|nr:hypothetical protein NDU88_004150 [Pleurodeles waltl]
MWLESANPAHGRQGLRFSSEEATGSRATELNCKVTNMATNEQPPQRYWDRTPSQTIRKSRQHAFQVASTTW